MNVIEDVGLCLSNCVVTQISPKWNDMLFKARFWFEYQIWWSDITNWYHACTQKDRYEYEYVIHVWMFIEAVGLCWSKFVVTQKFKWNDMLFKARRQMVLAWLVRPVTTTTDDKASWMLQHLRQKHALYISAICLNMLAVVEFTII